MAGKARRGRTGGPVWQPHRPARSCYRGAEPALVRGQYRASYHRCPEAGRWQSAALGCAQCAAGVDPAVDFRFKMFQLLRDEPDSLAFADLGLLTVQIGNDAPDPWP